MSKIPVYSIHLPHYRIDSEPDSKAIGKIIDGELKKYFLGQEIVFRGIASSEHENKTQNELIELIRIEGTDRYDPIRKGDRYENIEGKHIDFFGFPCNITSNLKIGHFMIWGFYHSAIGVHGYPMRIDVITIYDLAKLHQIHHRYKDRSNIKNDGFVFKNPKNRLEALKAIFKITD